MKYLLIMLSVLLSLSVFAQRQHPEGWDQVISQPAKDGFKFLKKDYSDLAIETQAVDTQSIYLHSAFYNYPNQDSSYSFLRFFGNGICFFSGNYLSFPEEDEFNDLSYGTWGAYYFEDDVIKIERYVAHNNPWRIFYATVTDEGDIVIYKEEARAFLFGKHRTWLSGNTGSRNPNTKYNRHNQIKLRNYKIDWD